MVKIQQMNDGELIRLIITEPHVYPYVTDDYSPAPEDYRPPEAPAYMVASDEDTLLGLFALTATSGAIVEVHTCLLPAAYGDKAVEAANLVAEWVWANTKFNRIITNVPVINRIAMRFAERAGMKQFGVNEKSFLKHGVYHDQVMLGLTRPGE